MKNKKTKAKPKVGRPSKFNSIDMALLKIVVEKGFTNFEICQVFKINRDTFQKYLVENKEFSDTVQGWKQYADSRVERSLYERACGYSHESEEIFCAFGKVTRVKTSKHYAPDPLSCAIWLKNRKPAEWRDKQRDPDDDELKDQELEFIGVPKKNGKPLPENIQRFLN